MITRRLDSIRISFLLLLGAAVTGLAAQQFPATLEVADLDGSNGFELSGAAAGDAAGTAVAGPGDLNQDGFVDLLIGAPLSDVTGIDAGITYVFYGGPDPNLGFSTVFLAGLSGSRGFGLAGASAGERSGSSVAGAGDVNDDGRSDLVIGAPGADDGGTDSGNSYVVYGDADISAGFTVRFLSGLDGNWGVGFRGEATGDASGSAVGAAGDINGDGVDDLLIGAPGADPSSLSEAGRVYVLFGGSDFGGGFGTLFLSSLDGSNGFDLDGAASGEAVGASVAPIGDLNNDGDDDLVVGAPDADSGNPDSGLSYVITGGVGVNGGLDSVSLGVLDGNLRFAFQGEAPGDRSGAAVASAGDLNDDGIDDLVIGAPDRSGNGSASGSAYVVFGGADVSLGFGQVFLSGLTPARGFELLGVEADDQSGFAVASVGDLNGDGIDDLAVGAPGAGVNGAESGSVFVLFGGPDVNLGFSTLFLSGLNGARGFRINGQDAGDRLGESVAGLGDLNADGFDDLAIGAPGRNSAGPGSGSVYVVFGREAPIFADGFEGP